MESDIVGAADWKYFGNILDSKLDFAFKKTDKSIDIVGKSKLKKEFDTLFEEGNFQKIKEKVAWFHSKYKVGVLELEEYLSLFGIQVVAKEEEQAEDVSQSMIEAISVQCRKERQLVFLPNTANYSTAQKIATKIFEAHTNKLVFPITSEVLLEGRITSSLYPREKKSISLIDVYQDKRGDTWLSFFGDKRRKARPLMEFHYRFYFYRFESNHRIYNLLSDRYIEPQFCKIRGMIVRQPDDVRVGETLKIKTDLDFVFASDIILEEDIPELKDVLKISANWNHDRVAQMIFGLHRHPEWFEKFYMAWLFSGKYDGYPLHIGIMGRAGTGKTRGMIEPLTIQIPEYEKFYFFDGTRSTLKGLVPSFGNDFNEGYYATRRRIAYVDEFLTALKRTHAGKSIRDVDETGMLTTLLEHKKTASQSGKTKEVSVCASAKMIITTNPQHSLKSIVDCAEDLNNPFMSRLLWYEQNKEHEDFINKSKPLLSVMSEEEKYPKKNDGFIKVFDYLNSFAVKIDPDKSNHIYKKYAGIIPSGMEEIYKGRYNHHYNCLVDGIAKLRWLFKEKETVEADDIDYQQAEEIFAILIASWSGDIELLAIPARAREKYLRDQQREVYDIVCRTVGISLSDVEEIAKKDVRHVIKQLESLKLVVKIDGVWYPHWHLKCQQLETIVGGVDGSTKSFGRSQADGFDSHTPHPQTEEEVMT